MKNSTFKKFELSEPLRTYDNRMALKFKKEVK